MVTGPHTAAPKMEPGNTLFGMEIEPVLIVSLDGKIRDTNPGFRKMLGYESEDLVGKPFRGFVHPDDVAVTLAEFAKVRAGAKMLHFENRWRCKQGTWKWLSWKAEPRLEMGFIAAIARDITEMRDAASSGNVGQTLTFLVEKLHAIDNRTRQFEGKPVQSQVPGGTEEDLVASGVKSGIAWWKWLLGFIAATGGVVAALFGAGVTYQKAIGNNATKDDIAAHKEADLKPLEEKVNGNTAEIGTVKTGVTTLVNRSEAEAKVESAQRVVDKWQKERDEQIQEWAAEKAAGRRRKKPEKRKELVDAELALEDARTELLKVK